MADATLSSDMDAFLLTANDAAARTELGLGTAAAKNTGHQIGTLPIFVGLPSNPGQAALKWDDNGSTIYIGTAGAPHADIEILLPSVAGALISAGDTGSVTNAMLAGSIAYSKLSLTGAILNADLAGSIAYSKLSLTGAIVDADLAGSISPTKITGTAAILGANTFNTLQTITQVNANTGILASTGYSVTGSNTTSMVSLAGTWNTSGVVAGFKIAYTNTACGSGSRFFSVYGGAAGATEIFSVDSTSGTNRLYASCGLVLNNTVSINYDTAGISIGSNRQIGWSSTANSYDSNDLFLVRDAAAKLQLGLDAAGVTNQTLKACDRITSDGVGANLTLDAGNGRGGLSGSLIFRTSPAAASGTAGTYATMLELTGDAKIGFYGATAVVRASAITAPSGGAVQDAESRTAIGSIITALQNIGITL